jgi:hypothetical protein
VSWTLDPMSRLWTPCPFRQSSPGVRLAAGRMRKVAALALTTDEEDSWVAPLLDLHLLSFASTRQRR